MRYPCVDWLTQDAGHLREERFGWRGNPHFGPFHLLSFAFIGGGFILIASAWKTLYVAQRDGVLATTGTYGSIRHPQYLGFLLVRSEEHTSELQSLMRISYAVFCL